MRRKVKKVKLYRNIFCTGILVGIILSIIYDEKSKKNGKN